MPFLIALAAAAATPAQCAPDWRSGGGMPGTNGVVRASATWDPDGAGPLAPRLVLAGDFTVAGDALCGRIAAYEPATRTWSAFGAGLDARVAALAVLPNGDLVAGGSFTTAGGVPANRVARWNGAGWQPLGTGVDAEVRALAVAPNGDLFAGGTFATAGGAPASRVARWDGATWQPLGGGITGSFLGYTVDALLVLPSGDLVVGGGFDLAGGVAVQNVARWDGASWSMLGAGVGTFPGDLVSALATLPSGGLVAGGSFVSAGGVPAAGVAQWNGTSWSQVGGGLAATVTSLAISANGDLIAGGGHHVARFDGIGWTPVGAGSGIVYAVAPLANGELIAGGSFSAGPGLVPEYARRFDGIAWGPLSIGLDNEVDALAVLPGGDLAVGGHFTVAGGLGLQRIARWDGGTFSPLGAGMDGGVWAVAALPNGDVVAGGWFTTAGGVPANRVARWDGASWSPLGSGVDGPVRALLVTRAGDLIATGGFTSAGGVPANRVARWDGTAWSPLGGGLTGPFVLTQGIALCELPNGDVVVGGAFAFAGGTAANGIARWDGASWSALGSGMTQVQALAVMPNGDLAAGGAFQVAGGVAASNVARWNGAAWAPLGAGTDNSITALLPLPDGDLIATGLFSTAGGVPARRIARWNGATWSAFGAGLAVDGNGFGLALARFANGDVAVGGNFVSAGGAGSAYVARLTTPCPAIVAVLGAGCTGSGGSNVLSAASLPWLGATCAVVGTGMPAAGLVVGVRGLGTGALPLASILPQGVPGCSLWITPDLLELHVPVAGTATESFWIPDSIALVGQTLHEQFVAFDIDAGGAITALTSTNALTLTLGLF